MSIDFTGKPKTSAELDAEQEAIYNQALRRLISSRNYYVVTIFCFVAAVVTTWFFADKSDPLLKDLVPMLFVLSVLMVIGAVTFRSFLDADVSREAFFELLALNELAPGHQEFIGSSDDSMLAELKTLGSKHPVIGAYLQQLERHPTRQEYWCAVDYAKAADKELLPA